MKKSFASEKAVACLIPGGITLTIILIALATKGMWPFGSARVDYFDNMQQVAPLYSHLWDWMHGSGDLFFDKYSGMGTSLSMSISAFSMLSPFNLILYLVPRDMILESFSLFIAAKGVCASITMYIFLRYMFRDMGMWYKTTFSVMYSLCGFAALYAPAFMPWMDVVALMPLCAMGLFKVLKERKKVLYIVMVAALFVINYYMGAMIMIYFLIISGCYIIFELRPGERLKRTWDLTVGSIVGVGLSAFILVPVFKQLSHSQRNAESPGLISQYKDLISESIISDSAMSILQRCMMVMGLSFVLALAIYGLKRSWKKREKGTMFYTCIFVLGLLPIVVQGVNMVWHFGSYYGYTLRMGYLVAFSLIFAAAGLMQGRGKVRDRSLAGKGAYIAGWAVAAAAVTAYILSYRFIPEHREDTALKVFLACFGAMTIFYLIMMGVTGKKRAGFGITPVMPLIFAELFIGFYSFLGLPKFYYADHYQNGDYVETANILKDELDISESGTERISVPDLSLNANYPLIMKRGSLSSFTAALSDGTKNESMKWGHSGHFLWMLDTGATPFSDALFHVTGYISREGIDSALATPVRKSGEYTLYEAKYTLPFAVSIDKAAYEKLRLEAEDEMSSVSLKGCEFFDAAEDADYKWISLHNAWYHALSGSDEDIAETLEPVDIKEDDKGIFREISFDVDPGGKDKALYISLRDKDYLRENENKNGDVAGSKLSNRLKIYVDGKEINISAMGIKDNKIGISNFNNNLIYLGTSDGKERNIKVVFTGRKAKEAAVCSLGSLDLGKLDMLCRKYEGYESNVAEGDNFITVSTDGRGEDRVLLIPEIYTQDMSISVDKVQRQADSDAGFGLFTAVALNDGERDVTIRWIPDGLKTGLVISGVAITAFIIICILEGLKLTERPRWLLWSSTVVYFGAFGAVCIFMIGIPVIFAIPALFM